jgi:hypothetical protein
MQVTIKHPSNLGCSGRQTRHSRIHLDRSHAATWADLLRTFLLKANLNLAEGSEIRSSGHSLAVLEGTAGCAVGSEQLVEDL